MPQDNAPTGILQSLLVVAAVEAVVVDVVADLAEEVAVDVDADVEAVVEEAEAEVVLSLTPGTQAVTTPTQSGAS